MKASLVLFLSGLLLVTEVAAGCGGGDETSSTAESSAGPPPADLVGSYATTLKPSDLPSGAAPPLEAGGWTLEIAEKGGTGGSPVLTISNDEHGVLESPSLSVSGDTLLLKQEECENAAGTNLTFVDSSYTWSLDGKALHISDGKGYCADKVASTILMAEPWTKGG